MSAKKSLNNKLGYFHYLFHGPESSGITTQQIHTPITDVEVVKPVANSETNVMVHVVNDESDNGESPMFSLGQQVWCPWKQIYYRAKIINIGLVFGNCQYYRIRFWKFTNRWDMTVPEYKLIAYTDQLITSIRKLNKGAKKKSKLEATMNKLVYGPFPSSKTPSKQTKLTGKLIDKKLNQVNSLCKKGKNIKALNTVQKKFTMVLRSSK